MQTDYFLFVSLDMISAILCLNFSNSSSISAFVSLCDEIVLIEALSGPKTTGVAPLSSLFETDLFTFHEKSFSRSIQITHNINYFDAFTHYAIAFLNIISKDCIIGKNIFNIRSVLIIDREKTKYDGTAEIVTQITLLEREPRYFALLNTSLNTNGNSEKQNMMGPRRFELQSQDPQPCRMDQATLRSHRNSYSKYVLSISFFRAHPFVVCIHDLAAFKEDQVAVFCIRLCVLF